MAWYVINGKNRINRGFRQLRPSSNKIVVYLCRQASRSAPTLDSVRSKCTAEGRLGKFLFFIHFDWTKSRVRGGVTRLKLAESNFQTLVQDAPCSVSAPSCRAREHQVRVIASTTLHTSDRPAPSLFLATI